MVVPSTQRERDEAAHVAYELEQMVAAAQRIEAATDPWVQNALLESTLLHVRSLVDFVTDWNGRDDVRASTFGTPPPLDDATKSFLVDTVKYDLNKHLVHITQVRSTAGQLTWDYPEVVRQIVAILRDYHAGLPDGSPAKFSIGEALARIDSQGSWPGL